MTGECKKLSDVMREFIKDRQGRLESLYAAWNAPSHLSESPLEDTLWHHLKKLTAFTDGRVIPQVACGRFRVDAMAVNGADKIVIEADGAKYHDRDKDIERDFQILHHGHATEIIRLPWVIVSRFETAMMAQLSRWHPALFDWRYSERQVLTEDELRKWWSRASNENGDFCGWAFEQYARHFDSDYDRLECTGRWRLQRLPLKTMLGDKWKSRTISEMTAYVSSPAMCGMPFRITRRSLEGTVRG